MKKTVAYHFNNIQINLNMNDEIKKMFYIGKGLLMIDGICINIINTIKKNFLKTQNFIHLG